MLLLGCFGPGPCCPQLVTGTVLRLLSGSCRVAPHTVMFEIQQFKTITSQCVRDHKQTAGKSLDPDAMGTMRQMLLVLDGHFMAQTCTRFRLSPSYMALPNDTVRRLPLKSFDIDRRIIMHIHVSEHSAKHTM